MKRSRWRNYKRKKKKRPKTGYVEEERTFASAAGERARRPNTFIVRFSLGRWWTVVGSLSSLPSGAVVQLARARAIMVNFHILPLLFAFAQSARATNAHANWAHKSPAQTAESFVCFMCVLVCELGGLTHSPVPTHRSYMHINTHTHLQNKTPHMVT